MTRNDLLELRSRLVQIRDLTFREGDKEDHAFTNCWLMATDVNEAKAEEFHKISLEATRIREQWTKMLDDCIDVLEDEVGVEPP